MVTIEVEVNKATVTRAAMILFIALGEYLLVRKINSLE